MSRFIFTFLGVLLPIGAHVADMAAPTHVFNDRWPPHAKFHGGQTLAMSIALGALTIFFAWRRWDPWPAFWFAVTYSVTQAAAIAYPGAAFFDPEFAPMLVLGAPIQLWFGATAVSLAALATWLSLRARS